MTDTQLVASIANLLIQKGMTMATAESCTGGLLAHTLTNASGSSSWFVGGVVVYANVLKEQWLGVSADILDEHGAVSRACVEAMSLGMCQRAGTRVGVAISGIAGPTGGTEEKPVGTVHMAWCVDGLTTVEVHHFAGNREMVKQQAVSAALIGLELRIKKTEESS